MIKLTLLTLVGALVAAGCSSESVLKDPHEGHNHPPAGGATATKPDAAPPHNMPHEGSGVADALGSPHGGEHFAVVLTTVPAEPKVGETKFVAKVLHHGEPFDGATVNVETKMPPRGHGGPKLELKFASGNTYEGSTKLPMVGEYEAKVVIVMKADPVHTNTFSYKFRVGK